MSTTVNLGAVRTSSASQQARRPGGATTTPSRPVHAGQTSPGVRLTRRGRLVVLAVVLVVAFVAFSMLSGPAASTDAPHHGTYRTVVVQPGETLWDIAGEVAPSEDRRALIAEIADLNGISDAGALRVGQPLDVPVS